MCVLLRHTIERAGIGGGVGDDGRSSNSYRKATEERPEELGWLASFSGSPFLACSACSPTALSPWPSLSLSLSDVAVDASGEGAGDSLVVSAACGAENAVRKIASMDSVPVAMSSLTSAFCKFHTQQVISSRGKFIRICTDGNGCFSRPAFAMVDHCVRYCGSEFYFW